MSDEWNDLTNGVNPFNRDDEGWHGRLVTFDDTDTSDFTDADLAEVIASGTTGDGEWDGGVAALLLLKDGRYVTYETFWGPTGNGFMEDAYGGEADICFSSTREQAIAFGLTEEGRRLCGLELPPEPVEDQQ